MCLLGLAFLLYFFKLSAGNGFLATPLPLLIVSQDRNIQTENVALSV